MDLIQNKKTSAPVIVYLRRGESIMDGLREAVEREKIMSGSISGIGAVQDVTIAYYSIEKKAYEQKCLDGELELLSLIGNIARETGKNQPILHLHVTLGDRQFRVFGGHLLEAKIAVVGEFVIWPFSEKLERALDPQFQLKTWNF